MYYKYYSDQNWYATPSNSVIFGTPLVSGTVLSPEGEALAEVSVNVHNTDWSAYGYASTDSEGYYEDNWWNIPELHVWKDGTFERVQ